MRRLAIIGVLFCAFFTSALSATVDTVSVFSDKMNQHVKAVVIKPDAYNGIPLIPCSTSYMVIAISTMAG